MQHFVLGAGRGYAGIRVVFEAHQRRHLGAKRFAVKFDCLLAAAVEKQIGLYSVMIWLRKMKRLQGVKRTATLADDRDANCAVSAR
jgi:hypothetical protein